MAAVLVDISALGDLSMDQEFGNTRLIFPVEILRLCVWGMACLPAISEWSLVGDKLCGLNA
jgi:hypothetical protein